MQARRGELVDVLDGEGLVAELGEAGGPGAPGEAGGPGAAGEAGEPAGRAGHRVGLITWHTEPGGASAEIRAVAVVPAMQGRGIGRSMVEAAHAALATTDVGATWVVTTNDNEPAVRLYESLGYGVVEIRRGAIDELRRTIKPSIPLVGHGGVSMHDEIELLKPLLPG